MSTGKTDADAVFGMIYAQAEDDFPRIEANYLTALGRTAEAEGEKAIWQDLRARLYVSDAELKADYARSPAWLQRLMDAWADGLNYFLATHPDVKPARAHAVRAVDGAVLHRRQHRRRHRAHRPEGLELLSSTVMLNLVQHPCRPFADADSGPEASPG